MPSDKMISKDEDGVGWIIFNNPERHNAISLDMWEAALEIMAGLSRRQVGARDGGHWRRRQGLRLGRRHLQVQGRAPGSRRGGALPGDHAEGLRARSTACRSRPSRWSAATASAAAPRPRCAATSASAPRTPSSACRRPSSASATACSAPSRWSTWSGRRIAKEMFFTGRQFDAREAETHGPGEPCGAGRPTRGHGRRRWRARSPRTRRSRCGAPSSWWARCSRTHAIAMSPPPNGRSTRASRATTTRKARRRSGEAQAALHRYLAFPHLRLRWRHAAGSGLSRRSESRTTSWVLPCTTGVRSVRAE